MQKSVRIIVAGGRDFSDYQLTADTLDALLRELKAEEITIVSGGCRGADALGEAYANAHGIPVKRFPADWKTYGRAAGPIRNAQMAEYASQGKGILLAFWNGTSRGTASMIRLAEKKGLDVIITKYSE